MKITTRQLVIGGAVCIAGGLLLAAAGRPQYSKEPIFRAAQATENLKENVVKLNDSLSHLSPSKKVTNDYLGKLQDIKDNCNVITEAKTDNLPQATKNGQALCKDLTPLLDYSKAHYTALQPSLSISTDPKRYKTFPGINSLIVNGHRNALQESVEALKNVERKDIDFPSVANSSLRSVMSVPEKGKKLGYLSQIELFQEKILAERQQFWTAYANIDALQQELNSELSMYCQQENVRSKLDRCKSESS